MPKRPSEISNKSIGIIVSCIILVAVAGLCLWLKKNAKVTTQNMPEKVHTPATGETVIDYNNIEKDKALIALMQKRKAEYGIEKGVDIITKSDESFKIGDSTVSMQEILDKIRIKSGDIVEKDLKSNKMDSMKLLLANPRGFCAGVDRAIEIVETALDLIGPPIYVRHEVVHNRFVVESLRKRGAIFVDSLDDIPDGQTVIFSAHGVAQDVKDEAEARKLQIFDATCPLVTKVHMEVVRHCKNGDSVVLIGHKGHPEVEGTMGQYRCPQIEGEMLLIETPEDVANLNIKNPHKIGYVTQTTLSIDDTVEVIAALRKRFPDITGQKKDDICYATQNRQDAVKELAGECDLILVVGSRNSSNSNRLREIAETKRIDGHLIDSADDIKLEWLQNKTCIGVTAGASAPELLVNNVVQFLQQQGAGKASSLGFTEDVIFPLPKSIR